MWNLFRKKIKRAKWADPFFTQKQLFAESDNITIFDIGAYIGDITSIYRQLFPSAEIYAFEPFEESFSKLFASHGKDINVFQLAISDRNGKAVINIDEDPSCNSLLGRPDSVAKYYKTCSESTNQRTVETQTIDSFCRIRNIGSIDILKIDVEGAETMVFSGASDMLAQNKIKVIYTEVMFVPHYEKGCLYHDIAELLDKYNYTLLNLYDLRTARDGQLRWGNAIFLSAQMRQQWNISCGLISR